MKNWRYAIACALASLTLGCGSEASGPLRPRADVSGSWLGFVRDRSLIMQLAATADGRVQGSGEFVGRNERFDVTGSVSGDEVELRLDFGGGLLPAIYSGQLAGARVSGSLDGSGFHEESLDLQRLEPDHPAVQGVDWTLVTPTPVPAGIRELLVRGDLWIITGQFGMMISRDEGQSWTSAVTDAVAPGAVSLHPTDPSRIAVGSSHALVVSEDNGITWREWQRFEQAIGALHVSADGSIWVGAVLLGPEQGIYRSRGWTQAFEQVRFGLSAPDLLTWAILRNPATGTLFVATELGTHPTPYRPPFLRSEDDGRTWSDVSGDVLGWHSIIILFDQRTQTLFTLEEGPGLFRSTDDGRSWERVAEIPALSLWIGEGPDRTMMLGEVAVGRVVGGAYRSMDGGQTVEPAGLRGKSVWGFARDARGRLLAAVAGEGIYATDDL